jgi:hypothetical protein
VSQVKASLMDWRGDKLLNATLGIAIAALLEQENSDSNSGAAKVQDRCQSNQNFADVYCERIEIIIEFQVHCSISQLSMH